MIFCMLECAGCSHRICEGTGLTSGVQHLIHHSFYSIDLSKLYSCVSIVETKILYVLYYPLLLLFLRWGWGKSVLLDGRATPSRAL